MMLFNRKKRIGLALGGGGARGWAHLGVIEAVEERGLAPCCVAGTSMGALVGGLYAAGGHRDLKETAITLDRRKVMSAFLSVGFPRSGLVDGRRITALIRRYARRNRIEDLPLAFAAVATDLATGAEVVLREGALSDAIRASVSVPGIFTPVVRDGAVLVDGGLVNPVPVSVARAMGADVVIAVDINHGRVNPRPAGARRRTPRLALPAMRLPLVARIGRVQDLVRRLGGIDARVSVAAQSWFARDGRPDIFEVLGNSLRVMEAQITEMRLQMDPPDVLIRPALRQIGFMDFNRAADAIEAGYRAAREQLARFGL